VVEGCYLMRNGFRAQEVWERMGFDVEECLEFTEHSPVQQAFRTLLFSRIVPCVKDIGLWGEGPAAYADLGVLDAADSDLEVLMRDDEDIAERIEQEHAAEFAARKPRSTPPSRRRRLASTALRPRLTCPGQHTRTQPRTRSFHADVTSCCYSQCQELKEAPSARLFMIMARNRQIAPKTGHDHDQRPMSQCKIKA